MRLVGGYADVITVVRLVLLYGGVFMAILAAIDWAVRTRRISPFNRVARFFRGNIDPLLAPVERIILRAGGVPSAASWWALFGYVIFAILVVTLLQFIGDIMYQVVAMTQRPEEAWRVIVSWILSVLTLALFVRVLSSWFPISPYSRWIRWSYVLTDWMIRPLQRIVPRIGMLDITPIAAWLILVAVRAIVLG